MQIACISQQTTLWPANSSGLPKYNKMASGTLRLRKVWIPEVYLGQERIGGQAAFIVNDHKDAGDDFDGVLGMKAPQRSKIPFDFERRRFSWDLSGVGPAATLAINHKSR
jgi:hypothetical protein